MKLTRNNKKRFGILWLACLVNCVVFAQHSPTSPFKGKIGKTIAETQESYSQINPQAQVGSPNVVWILIDDIGYGASTAFGGLIETPTFDRLANAGLRYTNWHTAAFCAPTRAALLTGCNPHTVHFGFFANNSYGTPGYDGYLPFEHATIAEVLRENGYNTYAVGKYHLTSPSDVTAAGPFNRWPTGRGFDRFYGYTPSAGAGDQWNPIIYRNTHLEPKDPQGRHFTELITNEALHYISEQKEADPNKPFFLYYAPGAAHGPHQVSREWIDKYKGKFDKGWDWYREEVLARQKKLGVVPQNTQLPPQNPGIEPWDNLTEDRKKLALRHIEAYAGFVSHTDHEIGRIVDYLEEINQLDNTLIVVMIGDNGATSAGGDNGRVLPPKQYTSQERFDRDLSAIDNIGSAETKPMYPAGWAAATNTPFRYYKGNPIWEGGTRDPLIIFYPKKIKENGIRTQYSYVSDILPTTIELTGAKIPEIINGYSQKPADGISLAYSIENPDAPERHTLQYHEMTGSYAVYKDGWKALFPNNVKNRAEDPSTTYLFNLKEDFNEIQNLSKKYPGKVIELQKVFEEEAWKYNVYPLKNKWENTNPNLKKNKTINR
ncbi:arylsulfatase [Sphingobacterium corticibacterium]|uniref:Arylsulfatase n=2 Tax=Sphingobacterium corticibacterium TaxID=2484746 RepID=A0A4Q6XPP6_9SPHI|nr:arylsulfatase [Sphingobacterium corticibacterium]